MHISSKSRQLSRLERYVSFVSEDWYIIGSLFKKKYGLKNGQHRLLTTLVSFNIQFSRNLLSFLLRGGTMPYGWGTIWGTPIYCLIILKLKLTWQYKGLLIWKEGLKWNAHVLTSHRNFIFKIEMKYKLLDFNSGEMLVNLIIRSNYSRGGVYSEMSPVTVTFRRIYGNKNTAILTNALGSLTIVRGFDSRWVTHITNFMPS